MVEAAGVEPASEGMSPQDSTCVSALECLTPGVEARRKPPEASPEKSRHHVSVPRAMTSPLNDA